MIGTQLVKRLTHTNLHDTMIGTQLVKRLTHTNKFTRYHDWYS